AITQGWHGRGSVLPQRAAVMQVMTLSAPASSPPLEVEFEARASAHDVTGQLRAKRLSEIGKQRTEGRAQRAYRVGERQRATTGDRLFATADRLFELLMTQQADGSFRLSPALQHWLGQ